MKTLGSSFFKAEGRPMISRKIRLLCTCMSPHGAISEKKLAKHFSHLNTLKITVLARKLIFVFQCFFSHDFLLPFKKPLNLVSFSGSD